MPLLIRRVIKSLNLDMRFLLTGGGWAATSQAIASVGSLLTALAFAHLVPPDAYGTYKYVLATATLLAIPTLTGMNTAVLQAVARGADGTAQVAFKRRVYFGLFGTLAGLSIGVYYFLHQNEVLGWAFFAVALAMPLAESLTVAQSILTGKRRFDIAARQSILSTFLTSTAIVVTIALTRDPLWIVIVYLVALLISRVITYGVSLKLVQNNRVSSEALRFGVHASIAGSLGIIASNIDQLVLWHITNPETMAVYAFALASITPVQALVKTFVNLAHPKFATYELPVLIEATKRRSRQALLVLIPVTAILIITIPYAYQLLFPAYLAAVPLAQALSLTLLLYGEKLYGIALVSQQYKKALYSANTINTVFYLVLVSLFIPLWGAHGAVAATLLQQLFSTLITGYFFNRMVISAGLGKR